MPTQGSFTDFMSALEALHQQVQAALVGQLPLRVYRWRPVMIPELPAIYPWISQSPFEVKATSGLVEDTVNVRARVAAAHVDGVQDGATLELIIDAYRLVVDTALYLPTRSPFAGVAKVVDRTGMQNVVDRFNDIPVLCMEFPLQAQLSRILIAP